MLASEWLSAARWRFGTGTLGCGDGDTSTLAAGAALLLTETATAVAEGAVAWDVVGGSSCLGWGTCRLERAGGGEVSENVSGDTCDGPLTKGALTVAWAGVGSVSSGSTRAWMA